MIISIFASIGSQNLGDELILKNEINILREKYSENKPKFIVFSYDYKNPFYKSSDVEYKEYFPIGTKNFVNVFKNMANFLSFLYLTIKSDLIVVGGGGIIYDNEKQSTSSPLKQWLFRTNIFRLLRKKIYFLGIGINIDKKNSDSYNKVKNIFAGAHKIDVRDDFSHSLLKEMGIKSNKILDPVFHDNNNPKINRKLCLKKFNSVDFNTSNLSRIDFAGKRVGIAFRRGYISKTNNPQLEVLIIKEIIEYIQKAGGDVILLPHSFHKIDILANDYEWMKLILEKVNGVKITNSMEETYSVYKNKKIDICLAERLHSIILSNVYDIEFIALSYSKKTSELLKEF